MKKVMTNVRCIPGFSCYKRLNGSQLWDSSEKIFSFAKSLRASILRRVFSNPKHI